MREGRPRIDIGAFKEKPKPQEDLVELGAEDLQPIDATGEKRKIKMIVEGGSKAKVIDNRPETPEGKEIKQLLAARRAKEKNAAAIAVEQRSTLTGGGNTFAETARVVTRESGEADEKLLRKLEEGIDRLLENGEAPEELMEMYQADLEEAEALKAEILEEVAAENKASNKEEKRFSLNSHNTTALKSLENTIRLNTHKILYLRNRLSDESSSSLA